MESKPIYTSKTVISAVVTIVASVLPMFGLSLSDGDQVQAVDYTMQAIAVLGGLGAIYGRIVAKTGLK